MKDAWRSDGFGGVDGIMVQNAAKTLNFSANVIKPIGIDFGFKAPNGTFFGEFFFSYYV